MEMQILEPKTEGKTLPAPLAALPEKFRDPESGEVRLDKLISSYLALEKKLSTMVPAPDTEEGCMKVQRLLGVPESPEEYEIDLSHGLFALDPDVNTRLHQKGFTAEQVQEVYNLAAEKLVPAILEMTQEFEADREVERLVAAFGGTEKWREVARQLQAFGEKNLPPEVMESLAGSFEGVMALYRMMKGQEPLAGRPEAEALAAEPADENSLRALMRDPKYWRDKDPSVIEKVTQGFSRLYEEK